METKGQFPVALGQFVSLQNKRTLCAYTNEINCKKDAPGAVLIFFRLQVLPRGFLQITWLGPWSVNGLIVLAVGPVPVGARENASPHDRNL